MSTIRVASRRKMKSSTFGLPLKKKFPLNTKRRAISAIAYSKKLAKQRKITAQERDIVLRKVHKRYPSIKITPAKRRIHHSSFQTVYTRGIPYMGSRER